MNVVIVPFTKYAVRNNTIDNLLVDYWLDRVHRINSDLVMLPMNGFCVTNEHKTINGKNVMILNTDFVSGHQQNIEHAISNLTDTDKFVVLDNDCLIYDYSIFDSIFSDLDTHDIVGNIDSGTRHHPTHYFMKNIVDGLVDFKHPDNVMYRIQQFQPKEYRIGGRTRFAATLFGCRKNFYDAHNIDHHKNMHYESMEWFSRQVAMLTPRLKFKELPDFRYSLMYEDRGIIIASGTEDTRVTLEEFQNSSYYHIRNFSDTIRNLWGMSPNSSQIFHNKPEGIRLLAWFNILIQKVSAAHPKYSSFLSCVDTILQKHNIDKTEYKRYLDISTSFHRTNLL